MEVRVSEFKGMQLFIGLVKYGYQWQGDVVSRRWAECLIPPQEDWRIQQGEEYMKSYEAEKDFHVDKNGCVWIA